MAGEGKFQAPLYETLSRRPLQTISPQNNVHVASLILKHEMWFVLGECSHVLGKKTHLTGLSSSRLIAVLAHTEDKVKKYTIMVIIG